MYANLVHMCISETKQKSINKFTKIVKSPKSMYMHVLSFECVLSFQVRKMNRKRERKGK